MPAVVGEIVAGVIIGPSVLGLVGPTEVLRCSPSSASSSCCSTSAWRWTSRDLGAVGRASMSVAVVGVVAADGRRLRRRRRRSGTTRTRRSSSAPRSRRRASGITARVFSDLRALTSVEARTVLGAAVADDVLGLVILTVVVRIVTEGTSRS